MPGSDRAAFRITGKVVEEFGAITLEVKKIEWRAVFSQTKLLFQ